MHRRHRISATCCLTFVLACGGTESNAPSPVEIAGNWEGGAQVQGGTFNRLVLTLASSQGTVTGTGVLYPQRDPEVGFLLAGTYFAPNITLSGEIPSLGTLTYSGVVSESTMTGRAEGAGFADTRVTLERWPAAYYVFLTGRWELTSIIESFEGPMRPATAEEARTWHVSTATPYIGDTIRYPVTVEWANRSGSGYWYSSVTGSVVRIEASLTAPTGGAESHVQAVYPTVGHGTDTSLALTDTIPGLTTEYSEFYRYLGPP
jgi:hypothetical protein